MPAATVIQMRRGTAADWTSANPTLHAGEAGFETDTGKLKVGDGATAWTGLPYIGSGGSGTVTTTGSPASGNLTKFSGSTSITSGDLSGDAWRDMVAAGHDDRQQCTITTEQDPTAAWPLRWRKSRTRRPIPSLLGSGRERFRGASYSELALGAGLLMSGTTLSVSGTVAGLDPRSAIYNPFTPAGVDDEFAGGSSHRVHCGKRRHGRSYSDSNERCGLDPSARRRNGGPPLRLHEDHDGQLWGYYRSGVSGNWHCAEL